MPLDVEPAHLAIVCEILARHLPEHRVSAFGSRVTGRARKYSDLDLLIEGEPLGFERLGALRDAFSESDLPYRVDCVEAAGLAPEFRALIGVVYPLQPPLGVH